LWKVLIDKNLICDSMKYKVTPEIRHDLTNQPFNIHAFKIQKLYFLRIVKTIIEGTYGLNHRHEDYLQSVVVFCEICQQQYCGEHLVSIEHFNFCRCKCGCSFSNKHEKTLFANHAHTHGLSICNRCLMRILEEQQYKHSIMHEFSAYLNS
jgi:hypothetical protein